MKKFSRFIIIILIALIVISTKSIKQFSNLDTFKEGLAKQAVLSVSEFYSTESPSSGIQETIDALPLSGGTVILPPGVYLLKQSVIVPSNVTIRGSGGSSILKKCAEFQTKMAEETPEGGTTLKVVDAEGFEAGMQIYIKSYGLGGWYSSQPVITRIEGNLLNLSEPLKREYDVNSSVVINYFPAIWIKDKRNVTIEDITIDGNIANNCSSFSDFVCAAVHCVFSRSIHIRNSIVRDWPSDGIDVQGGYNVFVTGCEVSGCRGHGFHPGTDLHHAAFSNNISHHNAQQGLFFCDNVRYINVTGSVFYSNGEHGIGDIGGGKTTIRDQYNVISNNICDSNGMCGIQVIQGNHNVISNNICRNNSRSGQGSWPGILVKDSEDITITGNLCTDEQEGEKKTQAYGIQETGESNNNIITSNNCRGNLKGGIMIAGENTIKADNLE